MRRRVATGAAAVLAVSLVGLMVLSRSGEEPAARHAAEPKAQVEVRTPVDRPTGTHSPAAESQPVEDVDCDGPASRSPEPLHMLMQEERWARQLRAAATVLTASTDAEHLLASAILGHDRDSPQSIAAFERALEADRDHPIILSVFLDACSQHTASPACAGGRIEKRAIAVEGRNGALWARIAALRSQRGNFESALTALQQASVAPEYDEHWLGLIRIIERSLAASTSMSYTERVIAAFGTVATVSGQVVRLVSTCPEMARQSTEWHHACLAFAERLEHGSRAVLLTEVSLGIQSAMHEIAGDSRAQASVDLRHREYRDRLLDYMRRAQALEQEQHILADYLEIAEADGELAAMEFLNSEVARGKIPPRDIVCSDS